MSPQAVLPIVIPIVVVGLFVLKHRRARPLTPSRLWIVPAIVLPLIGMGLWFTPHDPFGPAAWSGFAAALGLGGLAGWWIGDKVSIERRDDGRLWAKASSLSLMLLVGLLVGRNILRLVLEQQGAAWHLNVGAVTDAFLLFAVGLIVVQRVAMWRRARTFSPAAA